MMHRADAQAAVLDAAERAGIGKAESVRLVGELGEAAAPAVASLSSRDDELDEMPDGYNVDWFNSFYAFVVIGGTAVVVQDRGPLLDRSGMRILKLDSFMAKYGNRYVERRNASGKAVAVGWGKAWLTDRRRRSFDGITFHPDPRHVAGPPGALNLWRGFAVEPRAGGSYTVFRDHLLTNVARGDKALFQWIFGWFAQMVQQPRLKPGTAIVLRGGMGVGKTKVGEVFGSLMPANYMLVDDDRYVTGNFNIHLVACLLLQADEATWAGDRAAGGQLKGLVTAETRMLEAKGVDPVVMPNFTRLVMTSNDDWVVPAGKDERRFAVFDVDPRCAQNHEYFAEMMAELDAGGREALLADLLAFDLSTVNVRVIPRTSGLLEQKIRSLDPIEAWLLDRLKAGRPTRKLDHWPEFISTEAWCDDYVASNERIGVRRKATETQFGMKIAKLLPGLRRGRSTVPMEGSAAVERRHGYWLPPLDECRENFAEMMGQPIEWDAGDG
jgi:hypothetical protein